MTTYICFYPLGMNFCKETARSYSGTSLVLLPRFFRTLNQQQFLNMRLRVNTLCFGLARFNRINKKHDLGVNHLNTEIMHTVYKMLLTKIIIKTNIFILRLMFTYEYINFGKRLFFLKNCQFLSFLKIKVENGMKIFTMGPCNIQYQFSSIKEKKSRIYLQYA